MPNLLRETRRRSETEETHDLSPHLSSFHSTDCTPPGNNRIETGSTGFSDFDWSADGGAFPVVRNFR
jgi:hypothetical protein